MAAITEAKRDTILGDLLDSIIDGTSVPSSRIARRRRVSVGSVAAVRANLTRGTYGNTRTLVRKRRATRNS
jgi:hypothetical protein